MAGRILIDRSDHEYDSTQRKFKTYFGHGLYTIYNFSVNDDFINQP